MRGEADRESIEKFIRLLGTRATGAGRVYLVGGTTAVLPGWRGSTIDIDLKLDPEPAGAFEAIATLKDEFEDIVPNLIRIPAVDAESLAAAVEGFACPSGS